MKKQGANKKVIFFGRLTNLLSADKNICFMFQMTYMFRPALLYLQKGSTLVMPHVVIFK